MTVAISEKTIEQNRLGTGKKTRDDRGDRHGEHQDGRLFEQYLLTSVTHISSSRTFEIAALMQAAVGCGAGVYLVRADSGLNDCVAKRIGR